MIDKWTISNFKFPKYVCYTFPAPSIIPCHRDNPDLDNCIIKAVENVRPLLATGDLGEGYRSPPLEPLYLDNIELGRGRQFEAVFSDMIVKGGSNFIINKLS